MTSTNIIKDLFLSLIDDPDLAKIAKEDAEHLLMNWIRLSIMEFHNCRKELTLVEEEGQYYIKSDLDNDEIGILTYATLLYWAEPKIRCWDTVKQHTGTSDFSKLSNANTLLRLNELQDKTELKVRRLKNRYQSRDMVGLG